MSKLEDKVAMILSANNIKFKQEVSFTDLKGKNNHLLRYDFLVLDNYNRIRALIEVDGKQHYCFTKYFHKSYSNFLKAKEWDRRKNNYCLRNGYPLIRIPYWEIENLTLQKIFCENSFLVRSQWHNDNLINNGAMK